MSTLTAFEDKLSAAGSADVVSVTLDGETFLINAYDMQQGLNLKPMAIWYAIEAVHIRAQADLTSNILGTIAAGDMVKVNPNGLTHNNNIPWYPVVYNGISGWSDGVYLSSTQPPIIKAKNHKLGFMVLQGNGNQALINSAMRLAAAGRPYSLMVVLNDVGLANTLSKYVETVVLRVYVPDSNNQDIYPEYDSTASGAYNVGYAWPILNRDRLNGLNRNVYVQFTNEPPFKVNDSEFYYGVGNALETLGYKGVLFNDGVGHPEVSEMAVRAEYNVKSGETLFQWMITNGHLYGIHQYGKYADGKDYWPGDPDPDNAKYYGQRWIELFGTFQHPDILITECGTTRALYKGAQDEVDQMKQYNDVLMQHPEIKGCAFWAYNDNGGSWAKSNFVGALPAIENMIAGL